MHHVDIADQLPACFLVTPGLQACVREVHTCMPAICTPAVDTALQALHEDGA